MHLAGCFDEAKLLHAELHSVQIPPYLNAVRYAPHIEVDERIGFLDPWQGNSGLDGSKQPGSERQQRGRGRGRAGQLSPGQAAELGGTPLEP